MSASNHPTEYAEQKQRLLDQMLVLAKAQLGCLEENREDDLAAVLDESEALRVEIDALDHRYGQGGMLLSQTMRETLEQIRQLDEQCAAYVKERLLFYRAELKNIRQSEKKMQQYVNPYSMADGIFIDMQK